MSMKLSISSIFAVSRAFGDCFTPAGNHRRAPFDDHMSVGERDLSMQHRATRAVLQRRGVAR
jgi:hypothetical protein